MKIECYINFYVSYFYSSSVYCKSCYMNFCRISTIISQPKNKNTVSLLFPSPENFTRSLSELRNLKISVYGQRQTANDKLLFHASKFPCSRYIEFACRWIKDKDDHAVGASLVKRTGVTCLQSGSTFTRNEESLCICDKCNDKLT